MFESLLESQINKHLGEYIEGLNKSDLSVSIWGGDIELSDLRIRNDVFSKLKMPLELVYGRIGYLRIQVPWRSLGSKPVIVDIKDVWIVVRPISDQSRWEHPVTLETSFEKKEDLIREMAKQLFDEMIKSNEEKKEQLSFTSSLIKRIIDNLQVKIENVHVRLEHEQEESKSDQDNFSLGMTLQKIDLFTTDENWNRIYVDRTVEENRGKAMHKILRIENFGVYYRTQEGHLISRFGKDERTSKMEEYSEFVDTGQIKGHQGDYLILPILLDVKLTQNDPDLALAARKSLMQLMVGLDQFCITVHKAQYDNIKMLLDLSSEYMQFIGEATLSTKKINLEEMNARLERNGHEVTKLKARDIYQRAFRPMFDIIVATADEEEMQRKLVEYLDQSDNQGLYRSIVLGINSSELQIWAKEVVSEKAAIVKRELQLQKQKKSKGIFSRLFGSNDKDQSEEERQAEMNKIEREIEEHAQKMNAIAGNSIERQNIADMQVEFILNCSKFTLVNNKKEFKGVTLQTQELKVHLNQFDATNKYNKWSMDMDMSLKSYGIFSNFKHEENIIYSPFMQRISSTTAKPVIMHQKVVNQQESQGTYRPDTEEANDASEEDEFFDCGDQVQSSQSTVRSQFAPQTRVFMAFGNKEHHDSDLPDKDKTDLKMELDVQPIELIFRADVVGELSRFFKGKKLNDKTKIIARAKYEQLNNQVAQITDALEKDFKNNLVNIRIAAPSLVIPFKQESWESIYESECWVFTMGDVSFETYLGKGFDPSTHEAFCLKVERVKFEHANRYCKWKQHVSDGYSPDDSMMNSLNIARKRENFEREALNKYDQLNIVKILEDFSSTVMLLKKRSESEMKSKDLLEKLKADTSPSIQVKAQFDDEMQLRLRPAVFRNISNIGTLFVEAKKERDHYEKKKSKKLKESDFYGKVQFVSKLGNQSGIAAIIKPSTLLFWPNNAPENKQEFDLFGIDKRGWETDGLSMIITNAYGKTIEMRFTSRKQSDDWNVALLKVRSELVEMQQLLRQFGAEPSVAGIGQQNTSSKFGLIFTVPKISLTLQTSKTVFAQQKEWELTTNLRKIHLQVIQQQYKTEVMLNVQGLECFDNSDDQRFPYIIKNKAESDTQRDLLVFQLDQLDKQSEEFVDCETMISLGFSGLEFFWKPKTIANLYEFATMKGKPQSNRQNDVKDSQKQIEINKERDREAQMAPAGLKRTNDGDRKQAMILEEANVKQATHKGSIDKPEFLVKVSIKLAYLEAYFIHPDNNTYPVFLAKVGSTVVEYNQKCDYKQINLLVQNLEAFDCTNYADGTLDPANEYGQQDYIPCKRIIGLNANRQSEDLHMLKSSIYLYEFHEELRCEKQILLLDQKYQDLDEAELKSKYEEEKKEEEAQEDGDKELHELGFLAERSWFIALEEPEQKEIVEKIKSHDVLVGMDLEQIEVYFMMEQCLRIVDYSVVCIADLFDKKDNKKFVKLDDLESGHTNREMEDNPLNSDRFESEVQSMDIETDEERPDEFWKNFDLEQDTFCAKLALKIHAPLIVLPNLKDPRERFELDFGRILITSRLIKEQNRWVNFPDKPFYCMEVLVSNQDLSLDFKRDVDDASDSAREQQSILREDFIEVTVIVPIKSPYFEEKDERGRHIKVPTQFINGKVFDMDYVDTSIQIDITQKLFKLELKQIVVIELFNCLENNVMKKDEFTEKFTNALKKRAATIKQQESIQGKKKSFMLDLQHQDDKEDSGLNLSEEDSTAEILQQSKKKKIQVTIKATCLSLELRNRDDELIAEFCMVNFDYGLQIFADTSMRIYMNCFAMFIFHDEDFLTRRKNVMFGPINANSFVITDDDFYTNLPQQVRKQKLGEVNAEIPINKRKFSIEIMIGPGAKNTKISMHMRRLKFFMRPQVFKGISEFAIECLQKLDTQKKNELASASTQIVDNQVEEEEDYDPMNDSDLNPVKGTADDKGQSMSFNFKLSESIIVLERREFQKKAAVIQLGLDFSVAQNDIKAIERRLNAQQNGRGSLRKTNSNKMHYKPLLNLKCKVDNITPYIINIDDLEMTKFKVAKKRVLLYPFDIDVSMKTSVSQADPSLLTGEETAMAGAAKIGSALLNKNAKLKLVNKNDISVVMSTLQAQVSLDDLYIMQQLSSKCAEEALEIGDLWAQHSATKLKDQAPKKKIVEEQVAIPSLDTIEFEIQDGVDIVIISEDKGNFSPLFLFTTEKMHFNQNSGIDHKDSAEGNIETIISSHYFNAEKSNWEPIIERIELIVEMKREKQKSEQTIKLEKPLNLNISVQLSAVIHDFLKLWEKSQRRAQRFQKHMMAGTNSTRASRASSFLSTRFHVDSNVMIMSEGDSLEAASDIVSPYALRNLTSNEIEVQQFGSNLTCKINKGEKKSLATKFEETLNMSELDAYGRKRILSKDYFVGIRFHSSSMRHIQKFKLNQSRNFVKHSVFEGSSGSSRQSARNYRPNLHREFYVIQNLLENDSRRVLTIRTQHVMINKTQTTYRVKQFFIEKTVGADGKSKKERLVLQQDTLKPGDSIPLPDDRDADIMEKLKICIKPEGCKSWSEEFKVNAVKNKLAVNQNIVWQHHRSYSVLRKEATDYEGVFNYYLIPSLIIKNCLPMQLYIRLNYTLKTEEEKKANNRTEVLESRPSQSPREDELVFLDSHEMQRGEEKVYDTLNNQSFYTHLELHLNDQSFLPAAFVLQPPVYTHDMEDMLIPMYDAQERMCPIYARIDNSCAGNKVVIYAKNVLLCHTEQRLEFFYQKKTDLFTENNDHEFPVPVIDHRNAELEASSTNLGSGRRDSVMVTDRIKEKEPTIWIHQERKQMCAALSRNPDAKSQLVPINAPGLTSTFEVATRQELYMFQCATAAYQPSEKEKIFTRIVEVSPQFIVANQTGRVINFCQAHYGMDQLDRCIPLMPKDRQPFHWGDKSQPRHVKFFIEGASESTTPFTIADCGSMHVSNTLDGKKIYFRITKRVLLNSTFIIIEESANAPYKIDNLSQRVHMSYYQVGTKKSDQVQDCGPESSQPFEWRSVISSNFLLNVQFYLRDGQNTTVLIPKKAQDPKRPTNLEYSLDVLNKTEELGFIDEQMNEYTIYISAYTDQYSKVFEISDVPSQNIFETEKDKQSRERAEAGETDKATVEEEKKSDSGDESNEDNEAHNADHKQESKTKIELRQLNISLIKGPSEILTIVFDNWNSIVKQDDQEFIYEATLGRFQIDNHGQLDPLFPVILCPKQTSKEAEQNQKPVMEQYISIKNNIPNMQYINWLEFLVMELECKIELTHLMSMIEWFMAFNEKQGVGLTSSHEIFKDTTLAIEYEPNLSSRESKQPVVSFSASTVEESKEPTLNQLAVEDDSEAEEELAEQNRQNELKTWKNKLISDAAETIYIEHFKGSPLLIEVSIFKQTRSKDSKKGEEGNTAVLDLLGNLGLQFTNITGAPLQLNALEIENVYGRQAFIQELILNHYTANLKTNALKLIGSTDLLGNPTDFVNTMGTGARQFFYAPKEGFMKGPLQGGLGLIQGTGSLFVHTVGGAAGSISKVTNSLNRGFLVLSADTEYRQKKEIRDIKDKPTGVIDGVGKGIAGFGKSLWSGASGLVSQPFQGAKEGGITGFGKGLGRGVVGTIVKPVSGVVDLVSKTTEGIESQVDGGVTYSEQMRLARAFYKDTCVFADYSEIDAKVFREIRSTLREPVQPFASLTDTFYGAFKIGQGIPGKFDAEVLCLTSSWLFQIQPNGKLDWSIETSKLVAPTKFDRNPMREGKKLFIFYKENRSQGKLMFEVIFAEESKAQEACSSFADMFYMLFKLDDASEHQD